MRLFRGVHAVRSDELLALRERQLTYTKSLLEEKDRENGELQRQVQFYMRENETAIYPCDVDEMIEQFEMMQEQVRDVLGWLKRVRASKEHAVAA